MSSLPFSVRVSEARRRVAAVASMVLLGAIVVGGLIAAPRSPEDRVAALGSRIRCPVCQNEAIADSPSETARQMLAIVEEKVAAGEPDREIEQFFVQRYGEWVLLDPPLDGRFLLLWSLPVVALGLGLFAISRRRRAAQPDGDLGEPPIDLRRHALTDIEELQSQVEEGEITPEVAEGLTQRYRVETKVAGRGGRARARGKSLDQARRSRGRLIVGWLIGLLSVAVAVVMAGQAVEQEDPAPAARDLSRVSDEELEAVVAENPDVVGMRMALADRYFDEGQWEPALSHYLEVLNRDDGEADAWARAGWSVYQLGEVGVAAGYLERSLGINPDDPETVLYLGMIRVYGQDDAEAALPLLQRIDMRTDVPTAIRQQVEEAISVAERSIAEGDEG